MMSISTWIRFTPPLAGDVLRKIGDTSLHDRKGDSNDYHFLPLCSPTTTKNCEKIISIAMVRKEGMMITKGPENTGF